MGTPKIKAIETHYKGYRFRSRLEARWAVFFDAMEILWEYEQEGLNIDLGDWLGTKPRGVTISGRQQYLPDFWLPQVGMYAEVKPTWPTPNELALMGRLATSSGLDKSGWPESPVLILDGTPANRMYWAAHSLEFEHGNWDLHLWEYDIQDGHRYWQTEKRFYSNDGITLCEPNWSEPYHSETPSDCHGVVAARSARFEHGETPFIQRPRGSAPPEPAIKPVPLPVKSAPTPTIQKPPQPRVMYPVGTFVKHSDYGMGRVTEVDFWNNFNRVKIRFTCHGEKLFVAEKVKLEVISNPDLPDLP